MEDQQQFYLQWSNTQPVKYAVLFGDDQDGHAMFAVFSLFFLNRHVEAYRMRILCHEI